MSDTHTGASERLFRVTSEHEALALLERALAGHIADGSPTLVDFVGWPVIDVRLPRTPINASISPTMMGAFIELQTAIYRAHSLLSLNSGDLRGLSKEEKERLEFRVKVSSGSSEYVAELAKSLATIGGDAVNRMNSGELLIAVLGIALIIGGVISWKAWLTYRAEARKAETEKDEKVAWLEAQKEQLRHDSARYELLIKAMSRQPILGDVDAAADPARNEMIKAVGEEGGGSIQGVSLSSEFAAAVVSQKRQQGTPTEFSGIYRVSKVDTTVPDGFRVTLMDVETGEEISASLQDALVAEEHRTAIQAAEWNKRPIRVKVRARLLRNRFIDAIILSTEPVVAHLP